jgi:hypothetical protein
VSRLDSFIRRLEAQRACLDRAVELVRGVDGFVLELGLGNGRTYDHLRELFPKRDIYVCERRIAAHPDCIPPDDRLLLGDLRETLPAARGWMAGRVAFAHLDAGTGDAAANAGRAAAMHRRGAGERSGDGLPGTGRAAAAGGRRPRPVSSLPAGQRLNSTITGTWSEVRSQSRISR